MLSSLVLIMGLIMGARRGGRPVLMVLTAAVFIALLLACILLIPTYIVSRDLGAKIDSLDSKGLVDAKNEVRTTLLQALGGIFLGATAYFTWRQIQQGREGQLTERFTRAIEHLGKKDDLDIRLGGIHALERLGRDSKADRAAIVDILAAYVRGHAPWKEPASDGLLYDSQGNKAPGIQHGPISQSSKLPTLQSRAPDVQAAVGALTRGHLYSGHDERIELGKTDLRRAILDGAHLKFAILDGTHLEGADLSRAHLEGALLYGVHLEGANLMGAHLNGATLSGVYLEDANLNGAHLNSAYLYDVHLERANLYLADLEHARLFGAHLERALLGGAFLGGAFTYKDTTWPDDFDYRSAGVTNMTLEGPKPLLTPDS